MSHQFSRFYQPKARLSLVRTLFEQFLQNRSYYDLLLAQIEAFEKFLQRDELISKYRKVANLNCIAVMRKMAMGIYQYKNKKQLKETLLANIYQKKEMMAKSWLLAKVNQLK